MKKKPSKKLLAPTLHHCELIPVTDPVEFAALDRRCREALKKATKKANGAKSSKRK